ncbi:MAG: Ser/Thr protein kinase RdoA (MazF antagonist), partial [Pseudomonadales bacterium]
MYSIGLESGDFIVAKFYRPLRWSDETIIEEHLFCDVLVECDLPVIAPLKDAEGKSLHNWGPFRFSLYPRAGGRPPELDNPEQLAVIGRTIGRLHLAADTFPFEHRPFIDATRLGDDCADYLLDSEVLPTELAPVYE